MKNLRVQRRKMIITGGAGFIGSNAADFFLTKGWRIVIFDNLARNGSRENIRWLRSRHKATQLHFVHADVVADSEVLRRVIDTSDVVLHLAGQVAVTTSVQDPQFDFEQNTVGTINILEAVRSSSKNPVLIYASTNKVYGGMETVGVRRVVGGYKYINLPYGISEKFPLDFHSPYGCSKGAADQYVRDYARIYGLRTVVFRQSCIYGPRQFGIEDQGWIAWFAIAATMNRPITVYGDGYQIRDVLHVHDLCRAYEKVILHIDDAAGGIFNIGGGRSNTLSLHKTLKLIGDVIGRDIPVRYSDWRPGDQRIYVSDIRYATKMLRWYPRIDVEKGVTLLVKWVVGNRQLFRDR